MPHRHYFPPGLRIATRRRTLTEEERRRSRHRHHAGDARTQRQSPQLRRPRPQYPQPSRGPLGAPDRKRPGKRAKTKQPRPHSARATHEPIREEVQREKGQFKRFPRADWRITQEAQDPTERAKKARHRPLSAGAIQNMKREHVAPGTGHVQHEDVGAFERDLARLRRQQEGGDTTAIQGHDAQLAAAARIDTGNIPQPTTEATYQEALAHRQRQVDADPRLQMQGPPVPFGEGTRDDPVNVEMIGTGPTIVPTTDVTPVDVPQLPGDDPPAAPVPPLEQPHTLDLGNDRLHDHASAMLDRADAASGAEPTGADVLHLAATTGTSARQAARAQQRDLERQEERHYARQHSDMNQRDAEIMGILRQSEADAEQRRRERNAPIPGIDLQATVQTRHEREEYPNVEAQKRRLRQQAREGQDRGLRLRGGAAVPHVGGIPGAQMVAPTAAAEGIMAGVQDRMTARINAARFNAYLARTQPVGAVGAEPVEPPPDTNVPADLPGMDTTLPGTAPTGAHPITGAPRVGAVAATTGLPPPPGLEPAQAQSPRVAQSPTTSLALTANTPVSGVSAAVSPMLFASGRQSVASDVVTVGSDHPTALSDPGDAKQPDAGDIVPGSGRQSVATDIAEPGTPRRTPIGPPPPIPHSPVAPGSGGMMYTGPARTTGMTPAKARRIAGMRRKNIAENTRLNIKALEDAQRRMIGTYDPWEKKVSPFEPEPKPKPGPVPPIVPPIKSPIKSPIKTPIKSPVASVGYGWPAEPKPKPPPVPTPRPPPTPVASVGYGWPAEPAPKPAPVPKPRPPPTPDSPWQGRVGYGWPKDPTPKPPPTIHGGDWRRETPPVAPILPPVHPPTTPSDVTMARTRTPDPGTPSTDFYFRPITPAVTPPVPPPGPPPHGPPFGGFAPVPRRPGYGPPGGPGLGGGFGMNPQQQGGHQQQGPPQQQQAPVTVVTRGGSGGRAPLRAARVVRALGRRLWRDSPSLCSDRLPRRRRRLRFKRSRRRASRRPGVATPRSGSKSLPSCVAPRQGR